MGALGTRLPAACGQAAGGLGGRRPSAAVWPKNDVQAEALLFYQQKSHTWVLPVYIKSLIGKMYNLI